MSEFITQQYATIKGDGPACQAEDCGQIGVTLTAFGGPGPGRPFIYLDFKSFDWAVNTSIQLTLEDSKRLRLALVAIERATESAEYTRKLVEQNARKAAPA